MLSWSQAFGQQFAAGLFFVIVGAAACVLAELIIPIEKQSVKSWFRGLGFWVIFVSATVAVRTATAELFRYFGLHPAFSIDLRWVATSDRFIVSMLGYVVLPFVPLLIFDFLIYWFHRIQHAIPFLWRFHSVHHSIEELNGSNCSHHPLEELLRLPFVMLPLTLLLDLRVPQVAVLAVFVAIWNQLIHVNAPLSFGPLASYMLVDPRYHRVHHSTAEVHRDRNFATYFPIWDILFGTAYFPKEHENIKTGLIDKHEPETIRHYLFGLDSRLNPAI